MKSPARSRRHKTVEPIDFRELLDAPALNGLKEALAHRRESEADVPNFPAPPTIPMGGDASAAAELNASKVDAVELTADEFSAVEFKPVETTSTRPSEFRQPGPINKETAPGSNAAEPNACDFTALEAYARQACASESNTVKPTAVASRSIEADAPEGAARISQDAGDQQYTRPTSGPAVAEEKAVRLLTVMSTAVELTAVASDALGLDAFEGLLDENALGRRTGRRTFNVQPATRIETIFSPSELKVLNWMWSRGRAVDRVSMARLVTASTGEGMRRLAIHFGVAYTTFRNLVRSLSTKLAVEIVKQETTHPAIYLIYHYSAILERLRRAGLTGVIHKGSNAWVLVDTDFQPAPAQPELTLQELKRKLIALKATAVQATALSSSEQSPAAAESNALTSFKPQPGAVESDVLSNNPGAVNLAGYKE